MAWPEKFRAAIEKGVRDIAGELRKLNGPEKRQLLADLRKLDDCPDEWKNMEKEKQRSLIGYLHKAIERLLNPEKKKADNAKNYKRRIENGEAQEYAKKIKENGQQKAAGARNRKIREENGKAQGYAKKIKENGQQKIWNDKKNAKYNAKRSKASREANAQAILENKDHHEPTWDEDTLERLATENFKQIVEKCGPDGFVHVFVGAWPGKKLKEAVEAECFGRGRHAVFIDGGRRVHYHHVSDHVELFTPYSGTNCENADRLEKRVQTKLIDMGWPQHRRMFVHAGMGTCRGMRAPEVPFPYYTGVLVCEQSMEQIGIRLRKKTMHPKRKRVYVVNTL